jgi:hypothetical protein
MKRKSPKEIEAFIAAIDETRKKAQGELLEANRRSIIKCTANCYGVGCGKRLQVGKLTYIQTHWYVRPYSCNDGDYWNRGEGQFDCPNCGHRNRLPVMKYDHFEYSRSWFATIVNSHDEVGRPPAIDKPRLT